jgi:hypothetical protein
MNNAKQILFKLIEEMPDDQVPEVINFVSYLKSKNDKGVFKELEKVSESSMEFWNNAKDDEVWNNA